MQGTGVNYDYYFNDYCSGSNGLLSREAFQRFVSEASRTVADYITCKDDCEKFSREVANCICRVAEELFKNDLPFDIESETIDGYSVTYRDTPCIGERIRLIITAELGDTGLLFRGVE